MAKEIIKTNLKDHDLISLTYNGRSVEMTVKDFFASLPSGTLVISNTPAAGTSGIYSGSGYLPANVTVNGLAGYSLYFFAIDEFSVASNVFKLSDIGGTNFGTFNVNSLTDQRTYTFQDASGTLAFLSDIPAANNIYSNNGTVGAGRVATLTDYIAFNGGEFRTQNGYWQGTAKILYINPNTTTGSLFVGEDSGNGIMTGIGNIGIGYQSLKDNTTGTQNTGLGYNSLLTNTTGILNTVIGYAAMDNSTVASNCTVIGANALGGANSGDGNVAIGVNSMLNNTTGAYSVAIGRATLQSNTTGYSNVAIGDAALYVNTTGFQNMAIGIESMAGNTTGYSNTSMGAYSLAANQTGHNNVAIGRTAMQLCIDPVYNTVVGSGAMFAVGTSDTNSAYGYYSMRNNTSGSNNNAYGAYSLTTNSTGGQNCAFGDSALESNTTGSFNAGFGRMSLYSNTTGQRNVGLGFKAGYYGVTDNDTLYIHNGLGVTDLATGKSNSLIYGIFDAAVANQRFNINASVGIGGGVANGTSVLNIANLPTSAVGLVAGDVWNNLGVLTIV